MESYQCHQELLDISYNYQQSVPVLQLSLSSQPSKERKPIEWSIERLLDLLHNTNDGRCVLADSKNNDGYLSEDSQNTLTKLIINNLFQEQYRGNDFYFRKIADLIVEMFPKEEKNIYFISARRKGSSQTHSKGKLVQRWKNVARKLRSFGTIDYERVKKDLIFSPSWLEYKSVKYKKGMLLVLEVISGECLFGEIHHMLINNKRIPYFVVRPLLTIGIDHVCEDGPPTL